MWELWLSWGQGTLEDTWNGCFFVLHGNWVGWFGCVTSEESLFTNECEACGLARSDFVIELDFLSDKSSVWSITVWSKSGCVRNLNSCKCKFLDNENSCTHKRYKFKSQDKTMACYKHTYMLIRNVIILISFLMCGGWIPLNTLCSITSIRCGS